MTQERIEYLITDTGADKTAASFDKVATSMGAAEKSGGSFNAKVSGSTIVLQDLGVALGRADPRIAQFTDVITGVRSSLMGLTAALGGPVGLAVGAGAAGLIAGIEIFTRAQKEAEDAVRSHNEALAEQKRRMDEIRASAHKALGDRAPSEAEAMLATLGGTNLSSDDIALRNRLQAQVNEEEFAREQQRMSDANARELALINKRQAMEEAAGSRGFGKRGGSRERDVDFMGGGKRNDASGLTEADMAFFESGGGKDFDLFIADLAKQNDAETGERQRVDEELRRIEKERFEDAQRMREEELRLEQRHRQEMINAALGATAIVANAASRSMFAVVNGQKVSTKAIVAGIGEQLVADGTSNLLKAGAMMFIPGMQGAAGGLAAAAAAEIAGGLTMGAATAGGGGSGRSGGGGGTSFSRPVARVGDDSGGGGGTTYITVTMPSVVSPGADDGARVAQALERANAVHGTTVSRRVVQSS